MIPTHANELCDVILGIRASCCSNRVSQAKNPDETYDGTLACLRQKSKGPTQEPNCLRLCMPQPEGVIGAAFSCSLKMIDRNTTHDR
jgi:hypothetical protein